MTKLFANHRYFDVFALIIIFFVASYLRLGHADIVEFKRDEANLSQLALEMGQDGDIPLLGIGSSVGFPNAPVNVYILALPYALTTNPQFATQFIGLLNVIAVLMTYGIARRYTNVPIAFLIGLIFAFSPWSLIFSRKIWAQNMLQPFVVASVWTGIVGFIDGRRWAQWLHLPILAVTGQIHYVAFVLIPVSLYLVGQGYARLTRAFWLSSIPVILIVLPYLIGLHQGNLLSITAIRSALESGNDQTATGVEITGDALEGAGILVSGTQIHSLAGAERFLDYLETVPDVYDLFNVLPVMLLLACLWLIYRALFRRDARTPVDVAVLLWLITPIVAFSITWTPYFIHYLIPIFPASFLIFAFALYDLWGLLNPAFKRVAMVVLPASIAVILLFQGVLWFALLDFLQENETPGGFGTPLSYLMPIRDEVFELAETGQVIGRFDGQAIGFDGEASVWNALLYDVPDVRFEDRATRVFPESEAIILTDGCDQDDALSLFALREGHACYRLLDRNINHLDLSEFVLIDQTQPYRFANGVELIGYQVENDSEFCISIVWRITERTDRDYMFALPLYDASGERVLNLDGLSWFGRYWREGDTVLRRFCVASPDTAVHGFDIGMYTYDGVNFFNVDLLDSQNVPAGQRYTIDLDRVEP